MLRLILLFLLSTLILLPASQAQVSSNMTLHGSWDDASLPSKSNLSYNDIWGYAANGREYAILGSLVGTIFLDVTDPTSPTEVTRFDGGYTNSLWRDFKTYGNYAYGVADETSASNPSGLQIFDLRDLPSRVTKVYDSNIHFEKAHNIFIDEAAGRLYAVGVDVANIDMVILDLVARPDSPSLVANLSMQGGYIHDVFVRGDTAYCSHGNNGLYMYNLSNPSLASASNAFAALTAYPNSGYNHSSWLTSDGNTLIFADETHNRHLKVLDVSDFSNLTIVSTIKSTLLGPTITNSIAHNPFILEDLVFISYYHDGVQVYNISDPNNPYRLAFYDTQTGNTNYNGFRGCWGVYPFLPSGNIIASDVNNGLLVMEIQSQVLSAEKLELNASISSRGITLTWPDRPDREEGHFSIQRSSDGLSFEEIGLLLVETGREAYEFLDSQPGEGQSLYRLALVRPSGENLFSERIEVTVPSFSSKPLFFPNPVAKGESLHIHMRAEGSKFASLQVLDLQGRIVESRQLPTQAGWIEASLNLSHLPAGAYQAVIQTHGQSFFSRLLLH